MDLGMTFTTFQLTERQFTDNAVWLPFLEQCAGQSWLCNILWYKESGSQLGVWTSYGRPCCQESWRGQVKEWFPWGPLHTWVFQVVLYFLCLSQLSIIIRSEKHCHVCHAVLLMLEKWSWNLVLYFELYFANSWQYYSSARDWVAFVYNFI